MRCANCNRYLRNPGVEIELAGRTLVFGPVCATRLRPTKPKRRRVDVVPRTRVRRVQQDDLFMEAA